MCDACVNVMRETMETLTPAQQKAVAAFVAHEIAEAKEEFAVDHEHLADQIDTAHAKVLEVQELLTGDNQLDENTEVRELPALITRYAEATALLADIATGLERVVN